MNMHLRHAREVIGEATDMLIVPGTLRERLHRAAKVISGIAPGDFDGFPELKTAYERIDAAMTKIQDDRWGSFAATIDKMSAPTMKKLAEEILALDRAIRVVR